MNISRMDMEQDVRYPRSYKIYKPSIQFAIRSILRIVRPAIVSESQSPCSDKPNGSFIVRVASQYIAQYPREFYHNDIHTYTGKYDALKRKTYR